MTEKDEDEYLNANDQEKNLAISAYNEFKKKNYNAVLQHIHKLEYRSYDHKVFLNKAVVEYYKRNFMQAEEFEDALTSLCKQFNIHLDKLDDVGHCIVLYNKVVLLYHKRKFTAAIKIIEKLYKFIEPMDDVLARKVCFLAADLQLIIKMPDEALNRLAYIEDHLTNVKKQDDPKDSTNKASDPPLEKLDMKLSKYKARCYLMKRNLTITRDLLQLFDGDQWKVDAKFMNANQLYLAGQFEKAIEALFSIPQSIMNFSKHGESAVVLYNNNMGIIHHALGRYQMACRSYQIALKEEKKIQAELGEVKKRELFCMGSSRYHEIIYNLGISLLHAQRHGDAFDALIIAVRRYHRNSRLWLRIAECCINLHKPTNESDFDIDEAKRENCVNIIRENKKNAKYILTTNVAHDHKYGFSPVGLTYALPSASLEFASICLRNALILLPSESDKSPKPVYVKPGVPHPAPTPTLGPAPSSPIDADGIVELKNAILVASAYVSLCLGNYILALEYAETLLAQPRISSVHKLLGHLYASESLILLDKITEAMDLLNPENLKDLRFELPQEKKEANSKTEEEVKTNPPIKWFPRDIETARVILIYNLAAAKAIRGQFDHANSLMKQICGNNSELPEGKYPVHMLMLIIYIQLKLGHLDHAKKFIKQYVLP